MIDVRIGDCRQLIHGLTDESVDMVMTSPPYWGLRDYGHPDQIGLEATPEEYLKTMLDFFDDVKMKLKAEGNCFVNLGDTYYGSPSNSSSNLGNAAALAEVGRAKRPSHEVLQSKSLCMIPQRFAWGMIERGWILRNEIIWSKPNHMPESVTDRLTKAHEVIHHFVKQQRYYYNLDVIREPHKDLDDIIRRRQKGPEYKNKSSVMSWKRAEPKKRKEIDSYIDKNGMCLGCGEHISKHVRGIKNTLNHMQGMNNLLEWNGVMVSPCNPKGKNPGDVWEVTLQPYSEAHFAVFPIELVRRPILAGCPIGGTVLDPFGGSGTVGEFCRHNERNAILFELNPEYKKLIDERVMAHIPELGVYDSN